MKSIELVRKKVQELFEKYKERNFDIITTLMNEAGYEEEKIKEGKPSNNFSSIFFSFLCEELYKLCLKEKKIINSFYLIKNLPKKEHVFIGELGSGETENYKEIFPGIIVQKEIFYKVLESLHLDETLQAYSYYLIINEEELNESREYLFKYFSKEQLETQKKFENIKKIFEEEYSKKIKKKTRIIKFDF